MKYIATYTDTFGGEPNFAWVRKAEFEAPDTASDSLLIRRAKKALGIAGRHRVASYGETLEIRPVEECTVVFIEVNEEEASK